MSIWCADGGYSSRGDADRMADFFFDEVGAERAHVVRHPISNRGWWVVYRSATPYVSWHAENEWMNRLVASIGKGENDMHRLGTCSECGSRLTDPLSVAAGHGPTCSRRVLASRD